MVGRRSVAKAIVFALLPGSLLGQTVHGIVTDRATNAPVAGAIIQLTDSTGRAVSRALTSERGEFWVSAATAGTFRVRTLRIGFKPQNSDAVHLSSGEMMEMPLTVASLPVSLDTVKVASKNACMARGDTALATYAVWEQVRTALAAAQLTTGSKELSATLMTYQRALDPTFPHVRRQSTAFISAISGRPWRSTTPDTLRRFGYVLQDALGGKVYLAPDLDVLLSSAFLEDHCLRLARASNAKEIGIAFEPTKERSDVPEISGTVWMDRASAELREMQFKYEHLETVESDANPGGEMQFLRLTGGAWVISRWMIRMPVLEAVTERTDFRSAASARPVLHLSERRVTGGDLVAVLRGDDTVWARPPMILAGTVLDSASRDPVAMARLQLGGTPFTATTDKSGAFSISGVLPGEYTLVIKTPELDSLGATHTTSVVFTDNSQRTRILVPPADKFAVDYCGESVERPVERGLAIGTVRMHGDTTPPWNISVVAEWKEGGASRVADARTDGYGRYRICGVPLGTEFGLRTELDDTITPPRPVLIARRRRFVRSDIEIAAPATVSGTLFAGSVMAQWTHEPLADAEVSLPDVGVTVRTNERGRFRVSGVATGQHRVMVRKVGYSAVESSVNFSTNVAASRQFQLGRVVTLDTVSVTADPRMTEFEEHRRLGLGHFITRAELAKLEGTKLQDVLQQIPGAKIAQGFGNHAWLVRGYRGVRSYSCVPVDEVDLFKGAKPCNCYAQIYLDGMLVYSNKPPAGGDKGIPAPLFDLNEIDISQVEAIEFYTSEMQMPMQYLSSFANCGVLVIHTRRDFKKP